MREPQFIEFLFDPRRRPEFAPSDLRLAVEFPAKGDQGIKIFFDKLFYLLFQFVHF